MPDLRTAQGRKLDRLAKAQVDVVKAEMAVFGVPCTTRQEPADEGMNPCALSACMDRGP